MKKYILGLIFAVVAPVSFAYASTPVLTITGTGDSNTVTVQVTGGEINSPIELFFNQNLAGQGTVERRTIGTTDINGNFTGTVSTSDLGVSKTAPVYVQVGGYQSLPVNWPSGGSSGSGIVFTPSSLSLNLGQSGTVTVSGGGGGTYYIASNSNPNFTSASLSGNTLTLSGSQTGQSSITVCSTSGPCAVITPNFTTSGSTSTTGPVGSPTLSASVLNVNQGGQGSIVLSGGTTPYSVSAIGGSGNVSSTLIGNTLYVNGVTAGTATLNVCSANTSTTGGSMCTPVTVNVQTSSQTTPTTSGTLMFTLPLTSGEPLRLSLSGGSGSYFVQPTGTLPVTASVNGNILTLVGSTVGSTMINVCSTGTSSVSTVCTPISLMVSQPLTGTGGGYFFTTTLSVGMSGQDVMELQQRLADEGYFNVTPTGYFGSLTESAVKAYQAAHGLPAVGVVGPLTRALLNQ